MREYDYQTGLLYSINRTLPYLASLQFRRRLSSDRCFLDMLARRGLSSLLSVKKGIIYAVVVRCCRHTATLLPYKSGGGGAMQSSAMGSVQYFPVILLSFIEKNYKKLKEK